jgi:hypothetical protein
LLLLLLLLQLVLPRAPQIPLGYNHLT